MAEATSAVNFLTHQGTIRHRTVDNPVNRLYTTTKLYGETQMTQVTGCPHCQAESVISDDTLRTMILKRGSTTELVRCPNGHTYVADIELAVTTKTYVLSPATDSVAAPEAENDEGDSQAVEAAAKKAAAVQKRKDALAAKKLAEARKVEAAAEDAAKKAAAVQKHKATLAAKKLAAEKEPEKEVKTDAATGGGEPLDPLTVDEYRALCAELAPALIAIMGIPVAQSKLLELFGSAKLTEIDASRHPEVINWIREQLESDAE